MIGAGRFEAVASSMPNGYHHVAADTPTLLGTLTIDLGDDTEMDLDVLLLVRGPLSRVGIGPRGGEMSWSTITTRPQL